MVKGFFGLVLWLTVGFGFTGMTVLALNAWMARESQKHQTSMASQEASP